MNDIKIGDMLLIIKDIPSDEKSPLNIYLHKGEKGRVVNIFDFPETTFHINTGRSIFEVFLSDVSDGYVVCLSKQREERLKEIGI